MEENPLLYKRTPYHRRKSLTIEGSPSLSKEISYYRRKLFTSLKKALTIGGHPLQDKETPC